MLKDWLHGIWSLCKLLEHLGLEIQEIDHLRSFLCRPDNAICLKRDTAELLCKTDDIPIGIRTAQSCTRQDILHTIRLTDSGPQSAHQERGLHTGCTLIDVSLVQHNKLQLRSGEHRVILWTQHHILQHGIVRNQDMRRRLLHDFTGNDLIGRGIKGIAIIIPIGLPIDRKSSLLTMLGIPVIDTIANLRIPFEQSPHALHLVIGQSIHWVNDDCSDTSAKRSCFLFTKKVVDHRDEKAFRFTRAGAGRHNEILSSRCLQKR